MSRPNSSTSTQLRLTKEGKVYYRVTRSYDNGDYYDGELVEGLRHGQGVLRLVSGDVYNGEFQANNFHGFGVYTWKTVVDQRNRPLVVKKYEGEWVKGRKEGRGVLFVGDGDVYTGCFHNDLFDGQGVLKKKNGDILDGDWLRGHPGGRMRIVYAIGDAYEGEMSGGRFHGQGKMVYANNMGKYEGQWHHGQFHGKGVRIYSNGSKYAGDFFEGEVEGNGMMFYVNKDQYLGNWKKGLFDGKGVYKYSNGDSYEGTFCLGQRCGEGKFRYHDGGYYHGEYKNTQPVKHLSLQGATQMALVDGLRHGVGVRVWSTGAKYEGQWMHDKMHGPGVLHGETGGKYEGEFANGLRSGHGKEWFGNLIGCSFVCPLGYQHSGTEYCVYVGQYKQGLFHGYGEMVCQSGPYYKGEWRRGKKHGMGEQSFLKDGDAGNDQRLFIGGVDSFYRIRVYKGEYVDDEREGNGHIMYMNGDKVEGNFSRSQPHGTLLYIFASTGKVRLARYERGRRLNWIATKNMKAISAPSSALPTPLSSPSKWSGSADSFRPPSPPPPTHFITHMTSS